MANNNGRVLTLVIEITDSEKANWIWDGLKAFPNALPDHGIKVTAVGDGDRFQDNAELEAKLEVYEDSIR